MSIIDLLEQRTLIDTQICIKSGGSFAGLIKMTKGKPKSGKPKSSRKGKPTCNGDFTKKICAEQKSAVEEFKKANPDQKGAHLVFLTNYKKEHDEEWKAFQAEWKEAHPKDKDGSVSDASAPGSATGSATMSTTMPATVSEKKRVLTPEHLAKMKAGREAAKAAKAAKATDTFVATTSVSSAAVPAPVDAPVAAPVPKSKPVKKVKAKEPIVEPVAVSSNASVADDAPEELPFKHGGVTYIRLGNKREDGTYLWATGDLWANKKGVRGAYVGAIQDDGSVDTDALEPLLE